MPRNNFGEIAKTWMFASSSGSGMYETILYVKGTSSHITSCNCPGWTHRIDKKTGERSCKHTRMVEQGVADQAAESHQNYTSGKAPMIASPPKGGPQKLSKPDLGTVKGVRSKSRFLPNTGEAEVDLVDIERFRKMGE